MSEVQSINPPAIHLWIALIGHQVPRLIWGQRVAAWAGVSDQRGAALLTGAEPDAAEVDRLSKQLSIDETDLLYSRPQLVEKAVIRDNIDYLVTKSFPSAKAAAALLGTSEECVSRWRTGRHQPRKENLRKLADAAGVPPSIDLAQVPLCLLGAPVSSSAKRQWLVDRFESLDTDSLEQLFPALERMLRP